MSKQTSSSGPCPPAQQSVFRRKVFYIPGYDPFPPRRYRELYRKEGRKQASISGYKLSQSAISHRKSLAWQVEGDFDDAKVSTEIEVLPWADLVKQSMSQSILGTYAQLGKVAWIYIRSGALWQLMKLRKGPVIAALYPVGFLLLQLLFACGLGWLSYSFFITWLGVWAYIIAAGVVYAILYGFKRYDHRIYAYYLMHDYAHSAQCHGAYSADLQARFVEFEAKISAALRQNYDELLIIGHSSGAHMAITVLAALMRKEAQAQTGGAKPLVSLLTLGHVAPMISFLPKATRLRQDLFELSQSERLTWLDVSAPGDGCSFALCDPVAVSLPPMAHKRWPLVISAAFTQSLKPATWKAMRWRFFRLHFQYLCAFDQPKDYDYFQITAGPIGLGERFANRPPSKSRILRSLSPYQDRL